jgi:hypothetical protein
VRVGDTVRRPAGPWTPAVHALLDHLHAVGFPGARGYGLDDRGREVLDYLPGTVPYDDRSALLDPDDQLHRVGRLIRDFHGGRAGPPRLAPRGDVGRRLWSDGVGRRRRLGAHFWFDLLTRLLALRGGVRPPPAPADLTSATVARAVRGPGQLASAGSPGTLEDQLSALLGPATTASARSLADRCQPPGDATLAMTAKRDLGKGCELAASASHGCWSDDHGRSISQATSHPRSGRLVERLPARCRRRANSVT